MVDLRTRLYLWQTCVGAFLLRAFVDTMALRGHAAAWFFGQASELGCLATSVNAGLGLSSPFGGSTGPSAFLAPGYPLLIAAIFRLFGGFSRGSQTVVVGMQILFAAVTIAVLMQVAHRLFGKLTANLAGAVWAVSLPLLWLPAIFWETSFSILVATALLALALYVRDEPTGAAWAWFSVVSAIAIVTNPSLLTIVCSCGAWAAWQTPRSLQLRPLAAGLMCAVLCAPWVLRNYVALHEFVPLRTNSGYELWQGNHPGGHGFFDRSLHPNVNSHEFARYQQLGELAYMREKGDLAKDFIRQHPPEFLTLCAKRWISFWTGIRRDTTPLMSAHILLTTVFGICGLVMLLRRDRVTGWLFLLPILLFPAPYYLTHPDYRFRLVLDPLLLILGMYFITHLRMRSSLKIS